MIEASNFTQSCHHPRARNIIKIKSAVSNKMYGFGFGKTIQRLLKRNVLKSAVDLVANGNI